MGNAKSRKDKKLADVLTVATGDDDSNSPLSIVKSQDIEFGRRLAQGATGKVFEGKYKGKSVVLKTPLDNAATSEWILEAALHLEVKSHENIVKFIGMCQEANNFLIVEEHCTKGSLKEYVVGLNISGGGAWDNATLHSILMGVALGMQHLTKQNIVLRGLKSSNICLDERLTPKIVDFIDAKQYEGEVVCPKYPVALAWSAPETAREKKSTEKTDVYSFGALIFELLTGKEPFEGVKPGQIIERINSGKSITDGLDTSSMPKEAVELMEQCLQKDAGIRPTFDQIIQILQNHAQ